MNEFPNFMKHPANAISSSSQYSKDIEGYVFDGADGSQMAFWECGKDGSSSEHTHSFDEYFVVIEGIYTLIIDGKKIPVKAGQEYFISAGVTHAGEYIKGTRTIHAFGGKRAKRNSEL